MDVASQSRDVLFFFQAEDGIRDHCVTGVQTCALPIYRVGGLRFGCEVGVEDYDQWKRDALARLQAHFAAEAQAADPVQAFFGESARKRSEERRVGKEGRSRWAPYH